MSKAKYVTIVDYWLIGIPISCWALFDANYGLEGLWFGPTLAVILNYVQYSYFTSTTDWDEVAKNTKEKMELELK